MTLPRLITIGGIGTAIIVGGIISYLKLQPAQYFSPESTLEAYTDFLEKIQDPALKDKLAASCENGDFKQHTQDLEDYFQQLKKQQSSIKRPEAEADFWSEYIPRLGEHPLDLDGNQTPIEEEYIPRLGEQVPDLGAPEESDDDFQSEYIPRLGEHQLDFDGNKIPMEEDEYIPRPGEHPLDFVEPEPESINSILEKIASLEQQILTTLSNLAGTCDEDKKECKDACTNYINKCLTLVPNAGPTLFKQGMDSCLQECKKRNKTKIICIANAPRCEPMTDTCGL